MFAWWVCLQGWVRGAGCVCVCWVGGWGYVRAWVRACLCVGGGQGWGWGGKGMPKAAVHRSPVAANDSDPSGSGLSCSLTQTHLSYSDIPDSHIPDSDEPAGKPIDGASRSRGGFGCVT